MHAFSDWRPILEINLAVNKNLSIPIILPINYIGKILIEKWRKK